MRAVKKAKIVIKNYGGMFIRNTKHGSLYRFPNNDTILISGTPSSDGWVKGLEKRILSFSNRRNSMILNGLYS